MDKNKNLYKKALEDANTLKEMAINNAKMALEEQLNPKLQELFHSKLKEMEMADDEDLMDEFGEEDEFDIDSILAEIDVDSEDDDSEDDDLNKAEDKEDNKKGNKKNDKKDSKDSKKSEKDIEIDMDDDRDVTDLSVDELTQLITDIVSDVMGGGEAIDSFKMGDDEMAMDAEPAIDVDMDDDNSTGGLDTGLEIGDDIVDSDDEEEIDLEELLAELENQDNLEKIEDKDETLKEAIKTINILKKQMNEVTLLNSKLLYTNKIFNTYSLNEVKKREVLKAFDSVETLEEVEAVYKTLNKGLKSKINKNPLRENRGIASRAIGNGNKFRREIIKEQIISTDPVIERMQKLAGIKK